jgi:predicted MFS family arabinose efflux permease
VLSGGAAGWVWAPYSDIVSTVVPRRRQPTLLAVITTGTSVGLLLLAFLAWAATLVSWRLTWAGIALAAAVAALVNLRSVPKLDAPGVHTGSSRESLRRRAMVRPLAFAVLYFAAVTTYFTYASDAARSGGLGATAPPLLFALVGLGGLVGLGTGWFTRAVGATAVAVGSTFVVSGALVMLGLGRTSLPLTLLSALLLGAAFMVGSSLVAIWTAQVVPDRPGDGFTVALVVGAFASIAAPALGGAAIPLLGLPHVLVLVAVITAVGSAALTVLPRGVPATAHPRATTSRS